MANNAVTVILGLIFWIVVARYYSKAEVGWGNAVINAISLIALFSRLGLDVALIRFLPKAEKPVEMINSCFTISGIVSLLLAILFVAAVDMVSPQLGFINNDARFPLAFIAFTVVWTLSGMIDQVFIARRRADFVLHKNTIYSVLKLILPFFMVLIFKSFGIVSSWGIAVGIGFFIALFLFLPRTLRIYRVRPRIEFGIIKSLWNYSFRNYFVTLFAAAPIYILPLIIVNRLGPEQSAYFSIAWIIAIALYIIPMGVAQSLFAEGSHFEDTLERDVRRSYKFIFILLIPAIVLLLVLGKWLLLAFGTDYSENALMLLRVLTISGVFVGINSVYYTILQLKHRIRELIVIAGFTTLSALVTSYFITPTVGIVGVGYAWAAANGIVSVYVLISLKWLR